MHFNVSKQSSALQAGTKFMLVGNTHLSLPHDGLATGVPVPEKHGAVLAPAHDVAVARVVTLRPGDNRRKDKDKVFSTKISPRQTGDNSVMPEHNLTDLCRLCAVHSET